MLNYNDPVLTKMVQRQMVTNAQKKGDKIDFVVTWGYEYTANAYRIGLSEFHSGRPPKHNLPLLANKIARYGGTGRGGKGSRYIGNTYVKDTDKFWRLFSKKKIV